MATELLFREDAYLKTAPGARVVAVHERNGLTILREHRSVRYVHKLQHIRVVSNLQGYRKHILSARQVDVHCEG